MVNNCPFIKSARVSCIYYAPARSEGGNKRCFCPSARSSTLLSRT